MYPDIQKELETGSVLLEWDYSKGEPPAPLLKEKFSNERKKAKIMNFSIAYGKTVHGFMKDWDVSLDEAQKQHPACVLKYNTYCPPGGLSQWFPQCSLIQVGQIPTLCFTRIRYC